MITINSRTQVVEKKQTKLGRYPSGYEEYRNNNLYRVPDGT